MGEESALKRIIQLIDNASRIRDVLEYLLKASCPGAETEGIERLRAIPRSSFDGLLLDVRRSTFEAELEEPRAMCRIYHNRVGRVLVVVVETVQPQTMRLLCRNDVPRGPSPGLVRDLRRAFKILREPLASWVRFEVVEPPTQHRSGLSSPAVPSPTVA